MRIKENMGGVKRLKGLCGKKGGREKKMEKVCCGVKMKGGGDEGGGVGMCEKMGGEMGGLEMG